MKKIIFSLIFISNILFASTYNLMVKVENLRNNKGVVQFSLYNDAKKFPDEDLKKYYKQLKQKIKGNSTEVVFRNLPKGIYVVNILHDENSNTKVDKGLILPKEGIGLSNYKKVNFFNRPNFKDGSFLLDKDKTIKVKINYF